MLPSTTSRVEQNTADSINQHIRRRTEDNIAYFAEHPMKLNNVCTNLTMSGTLNALWKRMRLP
ncbi:hypothetical protein HSBAA_21670 [Vreelandella sulfidaeris]|uniref:Uncharacterized protein n=1 Tax=Vreelandella sulfidaeris TaxID=115553 RepID=A0A455U8M9_9GAMM|nr:hypothetical protein HSBAA_21670 [Halomonas sulfidaeris]